MNKHFKAYTTTFADCDAIDDATEAYGEIELDFPPDDCDESPNGHHEYDALRDHERCVHCGRKT